MIWAYTGKMSALPTLARALQQDPEYLPNYSTVDAAGFKLPHRLPVDMRAFQPGGLDYRALELHILRICYGIDIGYGTVINLPRRLSLSSEATAAALLLTDATE
jgi:hypothetical protein